MLKILIIGGVIVFFFFILFLYCALVIAHEADEHIYNDKKN